MLVAHFDGCIHMSAKLGYGELKRGQMERLQASSWMLEMAKEIKEKEER